MKKTLIITLEFPPQVGGIATYVEQMAGEFDADKVIVYAPKNNLAKVFDKNQKYKIYRKNPFFLLIWPHWLKLLWQVFWICRKEKIEIILIHHALPVGYVGLFIKKICKIPYIIFSHGTDLLFATRNKWKINRLRQVCLKAEQVIFNSESLQNRALRFLPEIKNRSLVLYPCPNKLFFEQPLNQEVKLLKNLLALDGKKVALSVSRFDEGKGLTHMVRLIPQILKKVPNFVWVVVGSGPKQNRLFEEVQKNFLQNVVRFMGQVPHEELRKYYYAADLFILLTHPDEGREEGLGLVFLEASAVGLPIIAGRSGGVEEAVLHTQTGLVVDVYQDLTVVSAIDKLMNDTEYARLLGKQAQERVRQDFQWSHQLAKLDKWLEISENINFKA